MIVRRTRLWQYDFDQNLRGGAMLSRNSLVLLLSAVFLYLLASLAAPMPAFAALVVALGLEFTLIGRYRDWLENTRIRVRRRHDPR